MTIASLIANGYITIGSNGAFSASDRLAVIAALEGLYASSTVARAVFDQLTGPEVLDISFSANTAEADTNNFRVRIDPNLQPVYLASNGTAVANTFAGILIHEIIHAVIGLGDVPSSLDGSVGNRDYIGPTVAQSNAAMAQYLSPAEYYDIISYYAQDYLNIGFDPISVGTNYTFGNTIDLAILAGNYPGNVDPGVNPNTSKNTIQISDLIIDAINESNAISSGLGNDFIYSRDGSDSIFAGAGSDYIDGGAGDDQVYYSDFAGDASGIATRGIEASWRANSVSVTDPWGGTDTLVNIEGLFLGVFDDEVTVSGDFSVLANRNNEGYLSFLSAGEGTEAVGDTIILDTVAGLKIDLDFFQITDGNFDVLLADFENAIGSNYNDTLLGDGNANIIKGRGGNDEIFGGQPASPITGQPEVIDKLDGGSGLDTITAGEGLDSVFGGSGADQIVEDVEIANQEDGGYLYGEGDNDTIDVSASADSSQIYGGSGNDTLKGNGASTLFGGSGADEFRIFTASSNPNAFGDTIEGSEAADTLWINGIQVTDTSPDIIFGIESGGVGGGPWYLPRSQGGEGFEHGADASAPLGIVFVIRGLADNFSGLLQDILLDMYIFTNVSLGPINAFGAANSTEQFYLSDAVAVIRGVHQGDFGLFATGMPSIASPVLHNSEFVRGRLIHDGVDYIYGYDLVPGPGSTLTEDELEQERLIEQYRQAVEDSPELEGLEVSSAAGGSAGDLLLGDSTSGSFSSSSGNDQVYAGAGDDVVLAGTGEDTSSGGDGADTLNGEDGDDVLFGDASPVTRFEVAQLEGADSISGGAGSDRLYGNGGDDTLTGDAGQDHVYGGSGNDTLLGGGGDDFAEGGSGDDLLQGDEGNDTLDGGFDADTVFGGDGDDSLSGGYWFDSVYGGVGNDYVNGADGFDLVDGGVGSDTLLGTSGNDTLVGGLGDDDLRGGKDADSYIYAAGDESDVIYDYGSYTDDDVIEFVDIASASASYRRVNDNLVITLQDGATLTVRSHYRVSNSAVELAIFSDAISVNLETLTVQTYLQGTDEDDVLNGVNSTTAEIVYAGGGNDSVASSGGNDTIYGEAGNDTLNGGAGSDSMFGGTGDDTFIVDSLTDVVIEAPGEGNDSVISGISLTLAANVENLTLSGSSGLSGTGNALANVLTGNSGANILSGLEGADTLVGGAGNDTYDVDDLGDVVTELVGGGTDLVRATLSWTLGSEIENLTLLGAANLDGTGNTLANRLSGNTGANVLAGGEGNDTLDGGSGNDTLNGGTGNDSMIGGAGDDLFVVDAVGDVVSEASAGGTDTVQASVTYTLATNVEALILTGSAAINGTGNTLANVITGNDAANLLSGGSGNDTITGGAGNDTLVADAAGDVLIEAADGGIDLVQSSVNWTLGTDFEDLALIGTSGLTGTGNALANVITGNSGANSLSGLEGNDTLVAGAGNDTLNGGLEADSLIGEAGNDTYDVDDLGDVVTELAGGGTDLVRATLSWTLGSEIENLTLLGTANLAGTGNALVNALVGNAGANALEGGDGNDTIDGGAGNDTLNGGTGNDSMIGGAGDDLFVVDAVADVVSEASAGGTDTVQASVTYTLATNVEALVLTGSAAINGTGNTLANTISGNGAANLLAGGSGNDTMTGGAGNDTLDGGSGTDSLAGGAGDDSYVVDVATDAIVELTGEGIDSVSSSVTFTLSTNVEHLTLTGTSGLSGTGNAEANRITGNSGANSLSGLDGNDTLIGGGGNDSLNGGLGADQFVFASTASGVDVIADFNELNGGGEEGDVLRFEGLGVGTFVYLGAGAFTGGSDNSEARVSGSQVLVDSNGDGAADITITLTGLTNANQLATDDFLFV